VTEENIDVDIVNCYILSAIFDWTSIHALVLHLSSIWLALNMYMRVSILIDFSSDRHSALVLDFFLSLSLSLSACLCVCLSSLYVRYSFQDKYTYNGVDNKMRLTMNLPLFDGKNIMLEEELLVVISTIFRSLYRSE
jgi:hypothetical protein